MNEQQIFDRVADHLATQKKQSATSDRKTCLYRGLDGTKCAFGIFIPDSCYDDRIEGNGASDLLEAALENKPVLLRGYRDKGEFLLSDELREALLPFTEYTGSYGLMASLQAVHDASSTPSELMTAWVRGLEDVARKFKLQFDPEKFIEKFHA
jgi:hypothetical protein